MGAKIIKNQTFHGDKVPKLTKILFPWSGIFRDACYALIGTFLMQYAITAGVLSSTPADFKAQYGVITVAMMIALVWDGINDPIMGFILEKVHFKSGKFRPWIEIGAIGNALVVIAMFLLPQLFSGIRGWGYVVFMIIMYVLWDTCFTMNDIGYWSMLPALTNDAKERATITTHTAIAASIGTFLMNIIMVLGQGNFGGGTKLLYTIAGVAIGGLFLITQTIVFFFCKEKARSAEQEEISEKSSILDLFKVIKKNKQLGFAALGMGLYYLASFILTGIGQNYFYMVYGYGSGGYVATMIATVYVLGTVAAQAFYPMLSKRFKKKQILTVTTIVIVAAYLAFFFFAFPIFGEHPLAYSSSITGLFDAFGGTLSLLYVFAFIFFGAAGIFYLAVLVMFQDAIDFGELSTGERKESICFAWRPLDVKLASGLNRGFQYLVYFITGTMGAITYISNTESSVNAKEISADAGREQIDKFVTDNVSRSSLIWFGIIVIGIIVVVFGASYIILRFCYTLDEDKVAKIVAELNEKNEAAIVQQELAAEGVEEVEVIEAEAIKEDAEAEEKPKE